MPTKDQWANWKDHPCTQAMMKWLQEGREQGFQEASYGSEDNGLVVLGVKLGKVNAYTGIINYDFIEEEEEDTNG